MQSEPLPVKKDGLSRVILDFGRIRNPQYAKLVITAWGIYRDFRKYQKPPYSAGTVIEVPDGNGRWKVAQVGKGGRGFQNLGGGHPQRTDGRFSPL